MLKDDLLKFQHLRYSELLSQKRGCWRWAVSYGPQKQLDKSTSMGCCFGSFQKARDFCEVQESNKLKLKLIAMGRGALEGGELQD